MQKKDSPEIVDKAKKRTFVPVEEGSATMASLDAIGLVPKYEQDHVLERSLRGAPWSRERSLKFMCAEVGLDEDQLIGGFAQQKSDSEIAQEMGAPLVTIQGLRKHFMSKGLSSIQGQD